MQYGLSGSWSVMAPTRRWAAPIGFVVTLAMSACAVSDGSSDAGAPNQEAGGSLSPGSDTGAPGTGGTLGTGGTGGGGSDAGAADSGAATGGSMGLGGGLADAALGTDAAMDGAGTIETGSVRDSALADGSDVDAGDAAGGSLVDVALGDTGIYVGEVLGFYSGDWGDMVLRQVGNEVWGAYAYDQGTIVGTIQGDALVGWWSETPSRNPTGDAGEVEFRWVRTSTGIRLDGRWKYGTTDGWREDWDIALVTDRQPTAELLNRLNDPSQFRRHP